MARRALRGHPRPPAGELRRDAGLPRPAVGPRLPDGLRASRDQRGASRLLPHRAGPGPAAGRRAGAGQDPGPVGLRRHLLSQGLAPTGLPSGSPGEEGQALLGLPRRAREGEVASDQEPAARRREGPDPHC